MFWSGINDFRPDLHKLCQQFLPLHQLSTFAMFTSNRSRQYNVTLDAERRSEVIDVDDPETSDVVHVEDHSASGMMPDDEVHQTLLDAVDAAEARYSLIRRSSAFASQSLPHVPSQTIPRASSQITPLVSSSPTCVCGTRRLCIGCITQGPGDSDEHETALSSEEPAASFRSHKATEANQSPGRPHRSSISDCLSGMAITADSPRRSMDDSSDTGSAGEWQEEERRCLWGDGVCKHVFSLSRTQGQSSLVTVIKSHLEQHHPEIQAKTPADKYTCQWDGCQDPLATVTSIARHVLTGKKHMDFGMPCPDCQEGSFRRDSLKIHRKRHSCKSRKLEL